MKVHPVTAMFPMMSDDELTGLVTDIRANGQREPLVLQGDMLLDGRNRLEACRALDIMPTTRQWGDKGDPASWIISINLHRRHMNTSQRSALGAELRGYYAGLAKDRQREAGRNYGTGHPKVNSEELPALVPEAPHGEAREQAAAVVNVSPRSVEAATVVMEADADLFAQVKAGEVTVKAAEREVRQRKNGEAVQAILDAAGDDGSVVRAEQLVEYHRLSKPYVKLLQLDVQGIAAALDSQAAGIERGKATEIIRWWQTLIDATQERLHLVK